MTNLALANHTYYDLTEKEKIWNQLNEKRRLLQKTLKREKSPLHTHKVYLFNNDKYYKIKQMIREYYIKVTDYENLSIAQKKIELYHFGYMGSQSKSYYIKRIKHTEKILLCQANTRDYFKPFDIQKNLSTTNK